MSVTEKELYYDQKDIDGFPVEPWHYRLFRNFYWYQRIVDGWWAHSYQHGWVRVKGPKNEKN